jgi:hypothetical protein
MRALGHTARRADLRHNRMCIQYPVASLNPGYLLLMVHSFEVQPTLTPYRQPTEPVHEYPTCRLQLRAASPYD